MIVLTLVAMLMLLVLPLAKVGAQDPARAGVPRPAACAGFQTAGSSLPAQHVPYPEIRKPWPVDVSTATIVKDLLVAHRFSDYFPAVSVEQVREQVMRYFVVPRTEWEHGYSHVGGGDEGGWLVAGDRCFMWTMRPGGLGWIVYPDGTAVYLAAEVHSTIQKAPLP